MTVNDRQEAGRQKALCLQCRHYFISWDPAFPYGCRAFRFKSALLPCLDVRASSGLSCLKFEAKKKGP